MITTTTIPEPYILFGLTKPFLPPPWNTTDDRLRGGASYSHLSALPNNNNNSARFYGYLDTSTLGGAGFAAQFSPVSAPPLQPQEQRLDGITKGNDDQGGKGSWWDLSGYDGIEVQVEVGKGGKEDGKVYTFILKDEEAPGKREEGDGREKAGVSWEVDFRVVGGAGGGEEGKVTGEEKNAAVRNDDEEEAEVEKEVISIWIPWEDFKATYRGKEKKDAGGLKKDQVMRVGFMMRSYFGKQQGDFSLVLRSVCARVTPPAGKDEKRNYKNTVGRLSNSTINDPQNADMSDGQLDGKEKEKGSGWLGWLEGFCTVS